MAEKTVFKPVGLQIDPMKIDESCTFRLFFVLQLSNTTSPLYSKAVHSSSELLSQAFRRLSQSKDDCLCLIYM